MSKNDLIMGDKISIHHSAIGAVGRGAVNYGNVNYADGKAYDYKIIIEELHRLKVALYTAPQNDQQIIAISEIIHAEDAARNEDGPTMSKHLKNLGTWVFNLARDIGVNVVASIISQ
jgi:hypothetical protein